MAPNVLVRGVFRNKEEFVFEVTEAKFGKDENEDYRKAKNHQKWLQIFNYPSANYLKVRRVVNGIEQHEGKHPR